MKIRRFVSFPSQFLLRVVGGAAFAVAVLVACSSSTSRQEFGDDSGTSGGGFGGDSGGLGDGGSTDIGGRDPVTCEEAQEFKTYVGCDYYPTVTANLVESSFDFAVVVANVGTTSANVTVTGPNSVNQTLTVAGGDLGIAYLPWVTALKGPSASLDDQLPAPTTSVIAKGGAYHLVSDVPVVVYQFNPIEFAGKGGPPGKDWSSCQNLSGAGGECFSYSNDASLLIPSTAMTGNYRIMGMHGDSAGGQPDEPSYFVVTATQDGTTVNVNLPNNGSIVGGSGISASAGGTTATFMLDAGDVAEIIGGQGDTFDFSGALLKADKPVQVITGLPCTFIPAGQAACDHVEETVFPVETLGKHYVVIPPSTPADQPGSWIRMYGNFDGTQLTYQGNKPSGCPDFLNAGQVADCGVVADDFEVTGDHEFGIATFMLAGQLVDPNSETGAQQGDPSESFEVAVEQYRKTYVFLAPTDYNSNFVDIVAAGGTTLTLDGADISSQLKGLQNSSYSAARVKLGAGKNGAHSLQASAPIGIQILGYGDYTTYQYPGGLNLSAISAVPVK